MENEKLEYPLTDNLIKFINEQRPTEGAFIISIIESLFQKNNSNKFCYKNDLIKKLIPLLGNQAENFVNSLFKNINQPIKREKKVTFKTENIFKKIKSNDNKKININDNLSSDFIGYGNFFSFETSTITNTENNIDNLLSREVILNKVNDKKYSPNEIKQFCAKFGKIDTFKKLNKEKWIVIFTDHESAANLVKTTEFICGDNEIKKYFNVFAPEFVKTIQTDNFLKTDLHSLLLQQQDLLDKISHTQNFDDFIILKNITDIIRQTIFYDDNIYKNSNKRQEKTTSKTIPKNHLKKISKLNNKHNKIEEIDSIFTQYFT